MSGRARGREGAEGSFVIIVEKQMAAEVRKKEKGDGVCNEEKSNQSRSGHSIMPGYLDYGIPVSRNLVTRRGERNGVLQEN